MILKRKKHPKMGLRVSSLVRCPGHLKWVRGHECCASGPTCDGKIHAHHLQSYRAIEGGMGLKVGDDKCVPPCAIHHDEIHRNGQTAFEAWTKTNLEKTAAEMWKQSPHGQKYRMEGSDGRY